MTLNQASVFDEAIIYKIHLSFLFNSLNYYIKKAIWQQFFKRETTP